MSLVSLLLALSERAVELCRSKTGLAFASGQSELSADERTQLRARKDELLALFDALGIQSSLQLAPMSAQQRQLWTLQQLDAGDTRYHEAVAYRLHGPLTRERVQRALRQVVARHALLRTVYREIDGEPLQIVRAAAELDLRWLTLADSDAPEALGAAIEAFVATPFQLELAPPLRIAVWELGADNHVLCINTHHIAGDRWSLNVMLRDWSRADGMAQAPLPLPALQYADYAWHQRQYLASAQGGNDLAFWQRELADLPPVHQLPLDRPRSNAASARAGSVSMRLPASLTARLRSFARSEQVSLFMLLQSVFSLLLSRLSQEHEVVLGTVVANREHAELADLFGHFVNTLVLRAELAPETSFRDWLHRTQARTLEAFEHQQMPFERVVEALNPLRSASYQPLYQVMFAVHSDPAQTLQLDGLHIEELELDAREAKFELALAVTPDADGISLRWEYSQALFAHDSVTCFARCYQSLLQAALESPHAALADLDPLSDGDRQALLSAACADQPSRAAPLTDLAVREQSARNGARIAVRSGQSALSYAELEQRVAALARVLRARGAARECLVATCLPRGIEQVVAMLAIWRSGAAYLPLDPSHPPARSAAILAAAQPLLLLGSEATRATWESLEIAVPVIDWAQLAGMQPNIEEQAEQDLRSADDLAYVIYTSGSTGTPKGVAIEHRQLAHKLATAASVLGVGADDVFPSLASAAFDISLLELLLPLIRGGTTVCVPADEVSQIDALVAASVDASIFHAVPSLMAAWLEYLSARGTPAHLYPRLRCLLVGGDAVPPKLLADLQAAFAQAEVIELYGPTEATIISTWYRYPGIDAAPSTHCIGQRLPGVSTYVIDPQGRLLPDGVPGELCLGGAAVARGYYRQAALSAAKFPADPFSTQADARMYRTGDLVRRQSDGNLLFLGRNDQQVKLRGFRIELGEIEHALLALPGLAAALVVLREDPGQPRSLVAYFTVQPGQERPAALALKAALAVRLPAYMVPSFFVALERLPLNANGKVDRSRLPSPQLLASPGKRAPVDALQRMLAELWAELLGCGDCGIDDNFFALGGHSLLAARLATQIGQRLQRPVPMKIVFEAQTIAELASRLAVADSDAPIALSAAPVAASYPLSPVQKRIWLAEQLQPGSALYHIPAWFSVRGDLDAERLRAAIQAVCDRHAILRTAYRELHGEPRQFFGEQCAIDWSSRNWLLPTADAEWPPALRAHARAFGARPFDLGSGQVLRIQLIRLDPQAHVLLFVLHHIAADGMSLERLLAEIGAAYAHGACASAGPALRYVDYAVWSNSEAATDSVQHALAQRAERLQALPTVHNLPLDRPRPATQSARGGLYQQRLPAATWQAAQAFGSSRGATPFMVLHAALVAFVHRHSGDTDIAIGVPAANREVPGCAEMIGCLVNTLVLSAHVCGEHSFAELLLASRDEVSAAFIHQALPFDALVERLAPPRSNAHHPLFQIMLAYEPGAVVSDSWPGLQLQALAPEYDTAKFDLTLYAAAAADGLHLTWEYARDLFDSESVTAMAARFAVLLDAALAAPEIALADLPIVSTAECRQLALWNATTRAYPDQALIHRLIENQVARTPMAPALRYLDHTLNYAELNARANRLAHFLRAQGVGPDVLVGLCLERSIELVVAILAIVKAGGAYVPLTPENPPARLAQMISEGGIGLVLCQARFAAALPQTVVVHVLDDASLAPALAACVESNPDAAANGLGPDHLAYVIFTSGSTGQPKGVMVSHRGLVNRIDWMQREFRLDGHDVVLQKTPYSFDVSVWEFFWPLLAGASLVLARPDGHRDPQYLCALIASEAVSTVHFVPSMLRVLLEQESAALAACAALRLVFASGEALPRDLVESFFASGSGAALHNLYGPTEASIDVSHWACEPSSDSSAVPIGRPIQNIGLHVLDSRLALAPIGVPGELGIAGVGLARGYLNRPELTAERFVEIELVPGTRQRVYRTGDLARWTRAGVIEYLGRMDHQVKIRGFRIELGEIEACLLAQAEIAAAVVLADTLIDREPQLLAYVVANGPAPDPAQLRARLLARLPDYMVPTQFVFLPALPLSSNGKIDRRRLPKPQIAARAEFHAPRNPTEVALAGIWTQVLGIQDIGSDDNFFRLGGHSLLAMRVLAAIRKRWPIRMDIRTLFECQELRALAMAIDAAAPAVEACIPLAQADVDRAYPVSFAQQRLWLHEELMPGTARNVMAGALELHGELDVAALQGSLNALCARHPILRTVYFAVDGEPRQRVLPATSWPLPVADLSALAQPARDQAIAARGEALARAFDLRAEWPLRAQLLRLGEQQHVLLLALHHIASDGWSNGILRNEISALYRAAVSATPAALPDLPRSYADFASWQRSPAMLTALAGHVDYWTNTLRDAPGVHSLPLDRARAAVEDPTGDVVQQELPLALAEALRQAARDHDVTLFVVLHASFSLLVGRYSGSTDVIVGTTFANRAAPGAEALVGLFMNPLALRTDLSGAPSFAQLLQRARAQILSAHEHQSAPFDLVLNALGVERSIAHAPLIQLMLILQNNDPGQWELPRLTVRERMLGDTQARLDLIVDAVEHANGLSLRWEFSTALFERASIERMAANFRCLLEAALAQPQLPTTHLPLLSAAESALLAGWSPAPLAIASDARLIHELFEAEVALQPAAIAVVAGESSLSYCELEARANLLAQTLLARGAGAGQRVAVLMPRSLESVIAFLGVLKAGAVYVPIEPEQPAARIEAILAQADPACVLIDHGTLPAGMARPSLAVAELIAVATPVAPTRAQNRLGPSELAYTIFTSGSTGEPKGVEIEHAAILASYLAWESLYELKGGTRRHLQMAGIGFDVCIGDLVRALCSGGTLVICPKPILLDAPALHRLLVASDIQCAEFVPIALRNLVQHLEETGERLHTLRFLVAGSDIWHSADLERTRRIAAPHTRVANSYGLTEAAVDSTCYLPDPGAASALTGIAPIGRPLRHATVHVLDGAGKPCPIGVAGELHIGGPGLARGYLRQPELTAERFISNPFGVGRLYRSGDLARWRADGELEILGRMDHQVKIRGFRVELGEIEARLKTHPAVLEAVVVDFLREAGDRQLAAYVGLRGEQQLPVETLRAHLAQTLPDYMVPMAVIVLPTLPMNANGKIDRKALPAPEVANSGSLLPAVNPTEAVLVDYWCTLLRLAQVSVDANFFHLGGHSLLAARLVAFVAEHFGVRIGLRAVFEAPTIQGLAERIAAAAPVCEAPINAVDRSGDMPLSSAQRRLWLIDQLEPGSAQYNIALALRIDGGLSRAALAQALTWVVARHEILRTSYHEGDGQAYQRVASAQTFHLPLVDLSALSPVEREAALEQHATSEAGTPFDLCQDLMLRAVLIELAAREHVVLFTLHHIAADGWSMGVLTEELARAYQLALRGGGIDELAPLPLQYGDYAVWQARHASAAPPAATLDYWREQLADAPASHSLPLDRPRPARQSHRGAYHGVRVDAGTCARLRALAREQGVTLFTVLHTALACVLARSSLADDVLIGTPVANRGQSQLAPLVGFFASTVVLRSRLEPGASFAELLHAHQRQLLAAIETHPIPFEQLVEALRIERSLRHHPLFQVLLVLQNNEQGTLRLDDLNVDVFRPRAAVSKFDLTLDVFEQPEHLDLNWEYAADLFDHATIVRLADRFITLLQAALHAPTQDYQRLPWMSAAADAEIAQLSRRAPAPEATRLVHEWARQIDPAAAALRHGLRTLDYGQLNCAANRLAHRLVAAGARPDAVVAILLPRSIELIVAVLAVLRAGAAYVGIDPEDPGERREHLLRDAAVQIVVADASLVGEFAGSGVALLSVDLNELDADGDDPGAPAVPELHAGHLAYLIYTSGTSGGPKAVLQCHRTLEYLVEAQQRLPGGERVLSAALPTLQYAALAFDVSIQEMATAWRTGSELVLIDKDERVDPERVLALVSEHRIGRLFLPPAMLPPLAEAALLQNSLHSLREVVVAGDALRISAPILAWQQREGFVLINHYGPSETHVVTQHRVSVSDGALPPIGQALPGHGLEVLDHHGQAQARGVPGELLVSGPGVARGYLNRAPLSAERFVNGGYRTGDLVRWRNDDTLEFLGRLDQQVKIRGYRVELEEIAAALNLHPAVADAAVIVRADQVQQNQLVAYVVAHPEGDLPSSDGWRAFLRQRLPDYMVPAAFVTIATLPLNRNGKLERARLPEPDWHSESATQVAPSTATEAALLPIWSELLGQTSLGVHDNFFHLGGHSLLAVQLVSRVQRQLGKAVALRTLLEAPTIAELAHALDAASDLKPMLGPLVNDPDSAHEPFPLTDVQQAYWLGRSGEFDLGNVGTHSYIEIPASDLDVERLQWAWNQLVGRHAMLRMVLTEDGTQRILPQVPLYRIECHCGAQARAELRTRMSHQLFSGMQWPLFELAVTQLDAPHSVLHVSIDALALDASSAIQLGQELTLLYQHPEQTLTPVSISFRDYVISEQALRDSPLVARARDYWHARLADFPPAPELPLAVDPATISQPHFSGHSFKMPAAAWQHLKRVAASHSVTPTAAVLGAFALVLARFSKHPRFALNLTLFNRIEFHEEVDRLIGDFTSLTLLEIDQGASLPFATRLQQLQRRLWADLEHKYYSGIEVQRELSRREARAVTFPVVVTSTLGLSDDQLDSGPFSRDEIYTVSQTPQVWLDFQLSEMQGQLSCNWDYVDGLFRPGVVEAMFASFTGLLSALATDEALWTASVLDTLPAATQQLLAQTQGASVDLLGSLQHLQAPLLARMRATPDAIAVQTAAQSLTYRQLDRASARLALALAGVQPNELVAVLMPKHWAQVVAVLGILRAGAAYLPIDASLPAARIAELLHLGEVRRIVSVAEVASGLGLDAVVIDADWLEAPAQALDESPAAAGDLAYVIFTSGSTGTPKGVMIDHRGALNTVLDVNARYGIGADDAVFGLSSLSFDLSVYDLFGLLGAGGRVVLPASDEGRDPEAWLRQLLAARVTVWNTVPALMQMLMDYLDGADAPALPPLRVIMLSGDWIPVDLPARIRRWFPTASIYSLGGATEASIWSIDYRVGRVDPGWSSVPYGKALSNQQVRALKPDFTPCPIWVPGELYLGGMGLAHGYWRDPHRTAERFVSDPRSGERWYRTGDYGRLLPDGNLEFLGREDAQVKIQGYRIELGEIEARLKQHAKVKDALVIAQTHGHGKRLLAYVVPAIDWMADADRQAFIAAQPGSRRDLHERPALLLPAAPAQLALRQGKAVGARIGAAALEFEQFSALFAALSAEVYPELPLPKRYYASAGGLYPTQVYVLVAAGAVAGLAAGAYYYDALAHRLLHLGAAPAGFGGGVQLLLIAELAAIEPLYGDVSLDFCRIEAGYIAALLQSASVDGIAIDTQTESIDSGELRATLDLHGSHHCVGVLSVSACEEASAPRSVLERVARKSYRRFADTAMADASWQAIARMLAAQLGDSDLSVYGWCRGPGQGSWRLQVEPACWQALTDTCSPMRLFPSSADLAAQAGFALVLVGSERSQLFSAGQIAQALDQEVGALGLGLCAIGETDAAEAARVFALPAGQRVLHALLGGPVSLAQQREVAVSSPDPIDLPTALKAFLADAVPAYMVPKNVLSLPALPLSANGKVDRKALPLPLEDGDERGRFSAASTPEQLALCAIWREVLGLAEVGVDDSFFACGGDSIRAIVVLTRARKLGIAFSVRELYAQQTIRALCAVARFDTTLLAAADRQIIDAAAIPAPFSLIDKAQRAALLDARVVDAYPMTWLQQGLVFHNLLDAERGTYHDIMGTRIGLPFVAAAFQAALASVVARHPVLRTLLRHDLNPPLQLVLGELPPPLTIVDVSGLTQGGQEARVAAWMQEEKARPFDLRLPPWQVVIHDAGASGFHYALVCHHALLDGWSVAQFNLQLFQAYETSCNGGETDAPAGMPFSCFVAEELRAAQSDAARAFWHEELQEAPLPWWTGVNGSRVGLAPHRREWTLGSDDSAAIGAIAKDLGVSDRSVFLGINLLLLSLLTGRSEALTSVVSNGRPAIEGAETALGLFLNTLPVRVETRNRSWAELLLACEHKLQAMSPHQGYPLALIQQASGLDFSGALFTYVNLHAYADAPEEATAGADDNVDLTNYRFAFEVAKNESAGRYRLMLTADDLVFDATFADRMLAYCQRALAQLRQGVAQSIDRADLIGSDERHMLLDSCNGSAHPVPEHACWHELFEAQVRRTPEAPAVVAEQGELSYMALNARANALAHCLRAQGVVAGGRVGLLLERGLDMVVAIYAVMKAGAAYVPLDPSHPNARLADLIDDAQLRLVLTHSSLSARIACAQALALDEFAYERWPQTDLATLDTGVSAAHPAYVIYTSGSTGRPKGVLVPHRGLVNRILWMDATYPLTATDVVLQKTPYGFDVSVWEFTWPLLVGARLVMARPDGHKDPDYLAALIAEAGVTTLHFVPSMLRLMLERVDFGVLRSVRQVFASGEALTRDVIDAFFASAPHSRLHNLYGPTEASIDVSYWTCVADDPRTTVPIGHPIWNTALHVLDDTGELAPLGVPGELHIGGIGLALGYLNRPDLTAERFVADPFSADPQARLYRTGDLVRRAKDGALEFLGRIDHQVKIRGFRIELGEIEAALRACPGISDAVVLAPDNERLLAYLESPSPDAERATLIAAVRAQLREHLPDYMVPAVFTVLARLPLNSSGKIDRKALPAADSAFADMPAGALPQTRTEDTLCAIWARLLRLDQVACDVSFFDVGGDSLSLVRLAAEIKREWGRDIAIMQIYRATSVQAQAVLIDNGVVESVPLLQSLTPTRTAAVMTIVAVPYAAGDGLIYHDLAAALDERVALSAVNNPRDFRADGDLDAQVEAYLDALLVAIRTQIATPLVIWGHCVGYALALTLTRRLLAAGADVRAICVGGVVIDADHVEQTQALGKHAELPADADIVELLTQAGLGAAHALAPDEWRLIVDKFKQDSLLSVWCNHEHFCAAAAPLQPVPLLCFVAADDPLTQDARQSARHWNLVSNDLRTITLADGGHYFVKTRSAEIAARLIDILAIQPQPVLELEATE
jgi:amino acid adenylation domain-containing protein